MSKSEKAGYWLPLLKLVRLPNVFTAAADSLAGWLIANQGFGEWQRWWTLPFASMCVYAAGMALNDYCDVEIDRTERPDRPIPAGQLTLKQVFLLISALFIAALALVLVTEYSRTMVVALSLATWVVAYDVWLRTTPFGPWAMGACRGLNLALGLSVSPTLGGPPAWIGAVGFGLFVTGITYISRGEVQGGRSLNLRLGRYFQWLALLMLLSSVLLPVVRLFQRKQQISLAYWGFTSTSVLLLLLVLLVISRSGKAAWVQATPERIQKAVKAGIFSLIWIDVALAATSGGFWVLCVAACWFPARLAARKLYST